MLSLYLQFVYLAKCTAEGSVMNGQVMSFAGCTYLKNGVNLTCAFMSFFEDNTCYTHSDLC